MDTHPQENEEKRGAVDDFLAMLDEHFPPIAHPVSKKQPNTTKDERKMITAILHPSHEGNGTKT